MAQKKLSLKSKNNSLSGLQLVLFAIAFGILGALISYAAFAAPRGGGKPGGGGTSATLVSDCMTCAFQSTAHLSGSGYDGSNPRGNVSVTLANGSTSWAGINVNPDGTTNFVWYMSPVGTYSFKVYQTSHNKMVLKSQLNNVVVQ